MPIYNWKWLYPLIGLSLGYAVLQQEPEDTFDFLLLFALPMALFALLWIKDKERILLAIALVGISLNIDRSYHLHDDLLLSRWGYMVSTTSIAVVALYVLWFAKCFASPERRPKFANFPKFHLVVLAYGAALVFSFVNSYDLYISSFELVYQVQCLLLYTYLVYYINDEDKFDFMIRMMLVGLILQVIVVFIQYGTGTQFDIMMSGKSHSMSQFIYRGEFEFLRPGGTFHAYNTLADYLTTLFFITLGYLFAQQQHLARLWVGACWVLGTAALILTHSRGAWAGTAIGTTLFFVVSLHRRWITLKTAMGVAATGMLVLLPFLTRIYFRLTESDEGSGLTRIPLAKLAWSVIEAHPWFGVGMNMYGLVMEDYITTEIRGEWIHLVHNKYLLIFAEMGLLGIASFLLLIIGMIWLSYRCVTTDHRFLAPLALGIIASLLCDGLHMMVDIFQARATVDMFWVLAALAVAANRLSHPDVERPAGATLIAQPPTGWPPGAAGQPR